MGIYLVQRDAVKLVGGQFLIGYPLRRELVKRLAFWAKAWQRFERTGPPSYVICILLDGMPEWKRDTWKRDTPFCGYGVDPPQRANL